MVAKMNEAAGEGAGDALLLEEAEGGHGGNADIEQMARQHAYIFYFLWQSLAPEAEVPHVRLHQMKIKTSTVFRCVMYSSA